MTRAEDIRRRLGCLSNFKMKIVFKNILDLIKQAPCSKVYLSMFLVRAQLKAQPQRKMSCSLDFSAVAFITRGPITRWTCCWMFFALTSIFASDDTLLVSGERLSGNLLVGTDGWKIDNKILRAEDVLCIRFTTGHLPANLDAGVFVRGGSLIAGTLTSVIGENAEISSTVLGTLKLKRDDIAGAFTPLPEGQAENMPELAQYSNLLGSTLGAFGSSLQPGRSCRIRFAGLDELHFENIMRIGIEQVLVTTQDKGVESINRKFMRVIELITPPPPAAPEDKQLGPEFIVRLKGGDLLRGRVVKMSEQGMTLRTGFMGEKVIERVSLAALFSAGASGSGVTWLSTQKPTTAVHTPLFDSVFPARMDASVNGGEINMNGLSCERGIGVHSRSQLEFSISGASKRFISVCGIDAETMGRGEVLARILADGREVWKSAPISGKSQPQLVVVDLGLASVLRLEVDYGPDEDDSGDHFDWGWAAVVTK